LGADCGTRWRHKVWFHPRQRVLNAATPVYACAIILAALFHCYATPVE
jgi:hypothetical protein